MRLQLLSEEVPPTGALSAPGALNALGRPAIGRWELFIRETIQNSWDARIPGSTRPVGFSVAIRRLRGIEFDALKRRVISGIPEDGSPDTWDCAHDPDQYVLEVTDRGTTGLGGPTRADRVADGPSDFADFMWNVGQPPDKERGGGTYGYGKSVLYLASKAATICVYSRCRIGRSYESRFMAAALGRPFTTRDGAKHTGRHWWGVFHPGDVIRPATGEAADDLATSLGLPERSGADTGTTILVVAADLDHDPEVVADRMRSGALWYCWPKVLDAGSGPEMDFNFSCLGRSSARIEPTAHPKLRHFVAALEAARADTGSSKSVVAIESKRPRRKLGDLALRRFTTSEGIEVDGETSPLGDQCCHVALMRAPNLVVRYLAGPESPVPGTRWAGVFVADDDADRDFAAAETPAHDDWVPVNVEDRRKRSAVKIALERIREVLREWNRPHVDEGGGEARPLGRLADALGGLLRTETGTGTGSLPDRRGGGGGGGAPRGAHATIVRVADDLVLYEGRPAVRSRFTVSPAAGCVATVVEPRIRVAVNDGAGVEGDPPLGEPTPELIHFLDPDGRPTDGDSLVVKASDDREWSVLVSLPSDTAVVLAFDTTGVRD